MPTSLRITAAASACFEQHEGPGGACSLSRSNISLLYALTILQTGLTKSNFFRRQTAGVGHWMLGQMELPRVLRRDRQARSHLRRLLNCACVEACVAGLVLLLAACGSDSAAPPAVDTSSSSTPSSSSSGETSSTSGSSSDSGPVESSVSSGTVTTTGETGTPDDCPAADPAAEGSAALVLAPDWPEGGTLDASCDAVAVEEAPLALLLVCSHPDTAVAVEVRLRFPALLDGRLDELVGATDLRASFFNPPRGSITCFRCYDLSVRNADGELLVLSHATYSFGSVVSEGESVT